MANNNEEKMGGAAAAIQRSGLADTLKIEEPKADELDVTPEEVVEEEPQPSPKPEPIAEPIPEPQLITTDDEIRTAAAQNQQRIQDIQTQLTARQEELAQKRKELAEAQKKEAEERKAVTETEATFRDPATGESVVFADPSINEAQIRARGLEFMSGTLPQFLRTPQQTQIQDFESQLKKELDTANAVFDEQKELLSTETAALIDNIKKSFAERQKIQQDLNQRLLGVRTVREQISGRSRFAPAISSGLILKREQDNFDAINRLKNQELQLITDAKIASNKDQILLAQKKLDKAEEINTKREAKIRQMAQDAQAEEERAFKRTRELQAFERQQFEQENKEIEGITRTVLNSLTGDEAQDAQIIAGFARSRGIDPNRLLNNILFEDERLRSVELAEQKSRIGLDQARANLTSTELDIAKKQNELNTREDVSQLGSDDTFTQITNIDNKLSLIDDLLNHEGLETSVGFTAGVPFFDFAGTEFQDFTATFEQLRNAVSLEGLQVMKGLGAMSEKEFTAAKSAVTKLASENALSIPEEKFKGELNKLKKSLGAAKARILSGQAIPTAQPEVEEEFTTTGGQTFKRNPNGTITRVK